jgi:hypothetical protein
MALLDLQAMQLSTPEYGGGSHGGGGGSASSTGCGVDSGLSLLICAASGLSVTACH